jgi:hypothetical protein
MSTHAIQILRMTHLRGPNIWTYRPVIEALIDIGDLEDCPPTPCPVSGSVWRLGCPAWWSTAAVWASAAAF